MYFWEIFKTFQKSNVFFDYLNNSKIQKFPKHFSVVVYEFWKNKYKKKTLFKIVIQYIYIYIYVYV